MESLPYRDQLNDDHDHEEAGSNQPGILLRQRQELINNNSHNHHGEKISALSNFSIQYNLCVIAPALLLLDHTQVAKVEGNLALYPRPANIDSLLKSSVFFGAVLGQSTMGFVADTVFGSLPMAMMFTNCLALVGTLGSTFVPLVGGGDYKKANHVYNLLAVSRAILGFGVGGKYPIGSAMRAQAAETDTEHPNKRDHRAREVAKGFFWQTPGAIAPYIVQLILLLLMGDERTGVGRNHIATTCQQYVLLVGVGAIPSMAIMIMLCKERTFCSNTTPERQGPTTRRRGMTAATINNNNNNNTRREFINPSHLQKLVGTGLSWALYDFIYYGTAFNQPEILAKVLGDSEGLIGVSWRDAVVAMMGIPGVVLAIQMIEPLGGPKPLQAWGFLGIGLASLLLLLSLGSEAYFGPVVSQWGGFLTCAILIFFLNWGCNVSTYVLPMEAFPKEVRPSLHGVSAGMGKIGALLGSLVFTQLNAISISLTFLACIASCCLGVLVTWRFVDPVFQNTFLLDNQPQNQSDSAGITLEPLQEQEAGNPETVELVRQGQPT